MRSCFRKDENVIVKTLKFEVCGSRGRLKQMEIRIENEMKKNKLLGVDAFDGTKLRGMVKTKSGELRRRR